VLKLFLASVLVLKDLKAFFSALNGSEIINRKKLYHMNVALYSLKKKKSLETFASMNLLLFFKNFQPKVVKYC
jgi:hypothetical protein